MPNVGVAQLVRASRCQREGREFESHFQLIWGMGLQGVVARLASGKTDGFDYHMLHC